MSSPARSGARRLTRLGSSTFSSAMAAAASAVPGNSSTPGATPRRIRPAASRPTAPPSTCSSPNRRLSGAATPENTPKASTGSEASTDTSTGARCSRADSSGNSGGRLVIAARRLNAIAMTPATSRTPFRA